MQPTPIELNPADLAVGDRLVLFFNERNINNKTHHVRGFVDDKIVLRHWLRHKQRWQYTVEDRYWLRAFSPYITVKRKRINK